METITTLSAGELAHQARSGQHSVTAIIEANIARIEQVNPRLNAVVTPLFESARAAANAADRQRASGQALPPLFGVPMTIQDSLDFADAPAPYGMLARLSHIPL